MRSVVRRIWIVLGALACISSPAAAETRSVSYSTWTITPELIEMRFLVPASDAEHLTNAQMPLLTTVKLQDYLLKHFSVTASGKPCPAIDQGWDLGKVDPLVVAPGMYGFEIFFRCPAKETTGLVLKDAAFFDAIPGHVNFARIATTGASVEQVFTAARQEVEVPQSGPVRNASLVRYISLGFSHLWRSLDRLCVLLGALLLLRSSRRATLILGGLAAGYAFSIPIAAAGWVAPRMVLIDALVGVLVAVIAAEIIAREGARARVTAVGVGALLLSALVLYFVRGPFPATMLAGAALAAGGFLIISPTEHDQSDTRMAGLAAFLGFLDGFVLPSALVPVSLTARTVAPMLIGYDLGAILGASVLFLLVAGVMLLLSRRQLVMPFALANDLAAAVFAGLGVFWMITRLRG